MDKIYDVAVIGAGAIGTAVSYYLSKAGKKVLLFDSKDIASGTSGRCDGNILVCDKMPGFDCLLAKRSQDMFPDLAEELDYPIEWHRKGSLFLIENEEEMAIAEKFCEDMVACGIPMRMMNKEEVKEDEPLLADDIAGGIETECDGSLNPMALCFGFALKAEKLGAELLLHNKVTGIEKKEDYFVVTANENDYKAKNVVNCGGIYAPEIGKLVGLEIPIEKRQGQILVSEQTFQVARRKVHEFGYLLAKFQGDNYKRPVPKNIEENGVAFVFEPTSSNNFLIGSSRKFVGDDLDSDMDVMKALAQRAIRFFPILSDIKVVRAYSGLRPFTPDHMPIVSATPVKGFYIAAGHEGDGIGLAPITGELITEMILEKEPSMDISALSFERF